MPTETTAPVTTPQAPARADDLDDGMELLTVQQLLDRANRLEDESGETPAQPAEEEEPEAPPKPAKKPPAPPVDEEEEEDPDDGAGTPADDGEEEEPAAGSGEETDDLAEQLEALAELHGVTADELKGFKNVEDAQRALRLADRRIFQDGQQALQQQQVEWDQQQQPAYEPPPPPPTNRNGQQQQQPPLVEIDLEAFGDDEAAKNAFQAMQKALGQAMERAERLEGVVGFMSQQQELRAQQEAMQQFHGAIDRMGSDRFGKGAAITPKQERNRQKLGQAVDVLIAGLRQRGHSLPPIEQLVQRAERLEFADELITETKRQTKDELTKRSAKRLGSPQRGKAVSLKPDPEKEMEEDPFFLDLYHKLDSRR